MKKYILLLLVAVLFTSMNRDINAFKIYTTNGNEAGFKKLVDKAAEADVVLFGELHNNPINHWLELELSKALYEKVGDKLIMGAEMFESDNSLILKEYLQGKVNDRNFEAEARLWPNYKTDYKPLLVFARDSSINFIATNIPRRYASLVNREGFEGLNSLDPQAKDLIAPLPINYDAELSGYKSMLTMMEGSGHSNQNLPKAQAAKDATMANSILKNLMEGSTFIHFHGTYHSDNFQGIMWYLQQAKPNLRIITISSVEQDDIGELSDDNKNKADFIIVTPTSLTKTH